MENKYIDVKKDRFGGRDTPAPKWREILEDVGLIQDALVLQPLNSESMAIATAAKTLHALLQTFRKAP